MIYWDALNVCNKPTDVETEPVYVSILSNLPSKLEPVNSNCPNLLFTDVEYSITLPIPTIVDELIEPNAAIFVLKYIMI